MRHPRGYKGDTRRQRLNWAWRQIQAEWNRQTDAECEKLKPDPDLFAEAAAPIIPFVSPFPPTEGAPPTIPPKRRGGRRPESWWPIADQAAAEWLEENGEPNADLPQARLEEHVADALAVKGYDAGTSTIRGAMPRWIAEHRKNKAEQKSNRFNIIR